jgi:hypothetical protein
MASKRELPKPWLIEGNPWKTEAKFLAWVRGVLRKGWSRHPIKVMYLQAKRKRIANPSEKSAKRFPEIWALTCAQCGHDFPQKDIEVDHIDAAGGFKALSQLGEWAERLYLVDFDSIRAVCKPCHKIKSYAEREGITFEEARGVKQAIEFIKNETTNKQIALLNRFGYNGTSVTTLAKRRALLEKIFKENPNAASE